MASKIDIPLECQGKKFGILDEDQKDLIRQGALDLVLLENAAELVRQVMMDGDHIERVLFALSKSKGCMAIPSQTFPLWMDPKITRYVGDISNEDPNIIVYHRRRGNENEEEYVSLIKETRAAALRLKGSRKTGCIFSVFALDLGGNAGGHYGAFYYDIAKDQVEVFDSMQSSFTGSAYTPFFRQLGVHIFGVKVSKSIINSDNFNIDTSLQFTGGFLENTSVMVKKAGLPRGATTLNAQSTESQNHFCYMWSIWFLHHKIMGLDVQKSAKEIYENHIDPLVVIKRYIWGIFHTDLEGVILVNKMPAKYRNFFNHNFLVVWTNDPERNFIVNYDFGLYEIPRPITKTVGECLSESLRSEKLTLKLPTTSTNAMKKCLMN